MAITGTTTADEALAEYLGALGYSAANDATMAATLVSAGNALLVLRPSRLKSGGQEVEFNDQSYASMKAAVAAAQAWINQAARSAAGSRVFDLRGCRD